MLELPASAIALIESDAHAHLVTINPDGSPQVSMVWSAVEDGEIYIASITPRRKLDNVRRDPRVAVSYESRARDARFGLTYYLVVRGTARITDGHAAELVQRLAERHLAPGVKFPPGDHPAEQGWILRIAPSSIHGYGPWANGR